MIDSVARRFFLEVFVANKISKIKKIKAKIKEAIQRIKANEIKLSSKI